MRRRFRGLGVSGFSLIEMLVVVVMIGLMSLFSFPRVVKMYDQNQVRGARQAVLNKFNTARMNARQSSRHTYLIRDGNNVLIERSPRLVALGGSTRDTVGSIINLRATWDVAPSGFTSITIDPRGLAQASGGGPPWTLTLSRGDASDVIVISGFGQVGR